MQHLFAAKPVFDKALFVVTSQALKLLPLLLCLGFINVLRAQNQSPNIIFILGDDIGYKTLTINGGNSYSTPNLDLMAKQGMNFTQCHATPLCSPSRVTLLTGKYNFRNYTEWALLDTSQRTFANMLHDAGYKTACFGKWQLHGGDVSVHTFGFDQYCIWDALDHTGHDPRYKDPRIYTDGNYMPDYITAGEYGEDIFTDSVMNFIEKNKEQPFFIYYPMVLAHTPYEPTPDDADFANWNFGGSDTVYYPSMIEYMDKKIGEIISKVKSLGIANNTVIIYTGDNGQSSQILENVDEDSIITGGKSYTTEFGTHVPLIIDWEGKIAANSVNNDLIDFSDFFPTMAGIAEIPLPTTYGPLDGVNFYPRLLNQPGNPRSWIFYHYDDHPGLSKLRRWAQNAEYKLYDTSYYSSTRRFYDIKNDINELHPIPDSLLTPDQVLIKQQLLAAINSYVAQGVPLFLGTEVNYLTDTSVQAEDSILINGGSTIKACGFVWSTDSFPTLSASSHVSVDAQIGAISKSITGLMPTTTYYLRSYATNYAGTAYGKQIVFKTLFTSPVATAATDIDSVAFTAFTANWNIVNNADNYNLDVSASRTFATIKKDSIKQLFKHGVVPENGWTFSKYIDADNTDFGKSAPSVKFIASGEQVVTPVLNGYATELKFWMKGLSTNSNSLLTVEGFDGSNWIVLHKFSKISTSGNIKTFNATSNYYLPDNIIQFRFTYSKSLGDLAFDDVTIKYSIATPSFINGFNNLGLQQNSYHISGLKPKTIYYYRVRAVNKNNISANSNIITVDTCFRPVIENISTINSICSGDNTGGISIVATGKLLGYNWKGPSGFNSIDSNLTGLKAGDYHLILTSNRSCAIDTTVKITEPDTLTAFENLKPTACNGDLTTLTINAKGGTGNYQYSLLDGADTIGPQNINSFTILQGSYKVIVQDENHCSFISRPVIITQPEPITITTNAEPIKCTGSTTTLTVSAKGGSAGYHYSVSDGVKIIGPQEDNHFLLHAGNYTVTAEDSNNCSQNENISINDATISCVDAVVFPNPSSNEFNLSIQNATVANAEIIVVDMYGKKVFQATGINTTQFTFGKNFAAGVYVLHIQLGDAVKTFKLIKARQ